MSQNRSGDRKPGAQSEKSETTGGAGIGTGAALREESMATKDSTQNVLSGADETRAATIPPGEAQASPPGAFAPFRYYVNNRIRNVGVTLRHAGEIWNVQELTIEGELRLANSTGDGFALVPLDERYIPNLFTQILER